jgi:ABC-2 type transport system ATP-binding protein
MNDDANAPVLELAGLSKTYGRRGGVRAVRDVSLSVGAGEVYGFLGPNGAGKSTTIRMLIGLIAPTTGEARLFGEDLRSNPAVLRRVGSLVDGGNFYPFLSGRRNLEVLARTQSGGAERIDDLLDQVGLAKDARRKVKGYSTGMRQRLGVAAALLGDPDLVILDEPVNGLDVAGIQEMRALIRSLAVDRGKTVFPWSAARPRIRVRISWIPAASRPFTGSSRMTRSGSPSKAAATPSRCRIPVE